MVIFIFFIVVGKIIRWWAIEEDKDGTALVHCIDFGCVSREEQDMVLELQGVRWAQEGWESLYMRVSWEIIIYGESER